MNETIMIKVSYREAIKRGNYEFNDFDEAMEFCKAISKGKIIIKNFVTNEKVVTKIKKGKIAM